MVQNKLPRWNALLEVRELEYEKDIITYYAGNKRDWMVVLVYLINYYNIRNQI